jgi:hypothetical protein
MSFSWLFLGGVVSTRARLRFTNRGQCAVNSVRWSRIFQRTAKYLLTGCLTPGGKCIVSFVTLKGLRIVHIPGSLVGYEPQFVAIFLNCAHDVCQPSPRNRLSLPWRLIGNVLLESRDDTQSKAQTENGPYKGFHGRNLRSYCLGIKPGRRDQPPSRVKSSHFYAVA